jgi:hypothetical protein
MSQLRVFRTSALPMGLWVVAASFATGGFYYSCQPGEFYEIGRHKAAYSLSDFAEVFDDAALLDSWSARGRRPSAPFLAPPPGFPSEARSRRKRVHYRAERLVARPRSKCGVTRLPLTLFKSDVAREFSATARAVHAAAISGSPFAPPPRPREDDASSVAANQP